MSSEQTISTGGSKSFLPLFLVFLSGVGFSIQSLLIKLLAISGFKNSFEAIILRGFCQSCIAAYFIHRSHVNESQASVKIFGDSRELRLLLALRSTVGFGGIAFAFLAVEKLPIGDSTVLVMLSPVFTSVLAACILKEPWEIPEFCATMISLMGAALVAKPSFLFESTDFESLDPVGVTYGLCAAVSAAAAYICVRMLGTSHVMPWANVCFAQSLGQVIYSIPCAPIFGQVLTLDVTTYQIVLLVCGAILGALSQVSMTIGMQREKSATATAMRTSDVLFGFLWQAIFTNESFDYLSIVGALLVTGSIFIIIIYKRALITRASNTRSQLVPSGSMKDGVINYEIVENSMDLSRNGEGDGSELNSEGFKYAVVKTPIHDTMDTEIELIQPKYANSIIHESSDRSEHEFTWDKNISVCVDDGDRTAENFG